MADPFTSFGNGLESGVRTGLALGIAYRNKQNREATKELLGLEAQIADWQPPQFDKAQQGAIPTGTGLTTDATSPDAMDGRTAPTQGYSGSQLRALVNQARERAAATGDPVLYANAEGRILDTLASKFQTHMAQGAALLSTDPNAAVEELAKASAYAVDGVVPQFNVVKAQDGTPVVIYQSTDPDTGKPVKQAVTQDMLSMLMQAPGTAKEFIAGAAKMRADAAGRLEKAYEREVTGYKAGTDFLTQSRDEVAKAFDALMPKDGKTKTKTTRYDSKTGDTVEIEVEAPEFLRDKDTAKQNYRAARDIATSIVLSNFDEPIAELRKRGAPIVSTVSPLQARDLTVALIDGATKGQSVPGLVAKMNEDDRLVATYNGTTVVISKDVLNDVAEIANSIRVRNGAPPLPTRTTPQAAPTSPAPAESVTGVPVPTPEQQPVVPGGQ